MARRHVTLAIENGLHLAPISRLVREANRFAANIRIQYDQRTADAKSVYDLMLLGATRGAPLVIEADGEDAETAIVAVAAVLECPNPLENFTD